VDARGWEGGRARQMEGRRARAAAGGRADGRREIARGGGEGRGDGVRRGRPKLWMQSGEKVCIYAKPQPLFAKLTKLQILFAKPLDGYFLLLFANRAMQSLFAKPLEMLLDHPKIQKFFKNFRSHRILRHMYEALNIDENKKLIT